MNVLKIINDSVPLFSTLESQYRKLSKLELEGLTNSLEYKKIIENINLINEVINKKLVPLIIDYDSFLDYRAILMKEYHIPAFDIANLDDFILKDNNYLKRLINYLYFLSKDISFKLDESFDGIDDNIAINTMNYLSLISSTSDIYDNLLLLTLFGYLLEEISNTTSLEVRNRLIEVKYRLLFLYPELEVHYLRNYDNSSRTNSFSKYLLKCLKSLDADYEAFKEIYVKSLYENIIEIATSMSKLDEEFFNIEENRIIVLIRVILIKTFMSINVDLNTYQKLVQHKDELLNNTKSEEAKRYLLQSFDLSNKLNIPKMVDL